MNTAISSELFNYLANTLKYNNIFTWKRSFKVNSCFISFNQLSKIYDRELCNNGLQLQVANYCCIALHHSCLLESLIRLYIFRRLDQKGFFHNWGTFLQPGNISLIQGFSGSKEFFTNKGFPWSSKNFKSIQYLNSLDTNILLFHFCCQRKVIHAYTMDKRFVNCLDQKKNSILLSL